MLGSSDLGHEQALLIVQAGTHVPLQGFLQALVSGGHSERCYLALLHTSATAVSVTLHYHTNKFTSSFPAHGRRRTPHSAFSSRSARGQTTNDDLRNVRTFPK